MTLSSKNFSALGAALLLSLLFSPLFCPPASCQYQEQTRELQLSLPMYTVTNQDGFDLVEIPGGMALNEIGMPIVPIYYQEFLLPIGERVQSVDILSRGGYTNTSGLLLPIFEADVTAGGVIPSPSGSPGGWFPDVELSWETWVNSNGSSTLAMTLYPFRYNANTTESSYCSEYALEATYVATSAGIAGISSDKSAYDPGETVALGLQLENAGQSEDLILGITILSSGSLEVIDALPLKTVHEFQGIASVQMNWTEIDVAPGEYIALAELNDTEGHWLSTASLAIHIGIPKLEITSFSAGPQHFEIGDEVAVEVTARNTGSVEALGSCIVQIWEDGELVQGSQINFTGLKPHQQRVFQASWDTSNATKDELYTALAYVSYNGLTTGAESCILSTNQLPVPAFFISGAASVYTGLNVTLDASASYDPDGEIAALIWDFGDYSSFNGTSVTHSYSYPGNYTVTLTAVDDKGAEGQVSSTIEVAKGYYLNASSNIGIAVEGSGLYREGAVVPVSAPAEAPVQGFMGTLGSKYVFKQWTGASNSTDRAISITVDYESSHLGLRAVYQEESSMAMAIILIIVAAVAFTVAFLVMMSRRRKKP